MNACKRLMFLFFAVLLIYPQAKAFDKISSYKNAKHPPFYSETFPIDSWGHTPQLSEARAFFKYANGAFGLVTNEHSYWIPKFSLAEAKPAVITFYEMDNNQWKIANVKINFK